MKKFTCWILFLICLLFNIIYAAQEMPGNVLNVIADISGDGILNVCETWEIKTVGDNFFERKIYIDNSKNEKVENVSITARYPNVSGEREFELYSGDLKFGRYSVDKSEDYYLIRCGIDQFNNNVIYDISYTLDNNLIDYKDCVEMKWYLFKNTTLTNIGLVSRRIKFPYSKQQRRNKFMVKD